MSRPRQPQTTTVIATGPVRALSVRVPKLLLEVVEGPSTGTTCELGARNLSIGSHPSNDLVLDDTAVSRFHCRIQAGDTGYAITDAGSTNGTFVNGVRIDRAYLPEDTQIRIGASAINVRKGQDEAEIELSADDWFGDAVGSSVRMRELFAVARRVAEKDASVLILGETGTGKDVLARAIHAHSARADHPFVICDCAAIPDNLIESALFGHVKGAFTGADRDHAGVFERAHKGTVFLDEIGELPVAMQPKLLRVLDGQSVIPVGGTAEQPVDVRIIAATNRDLREMVSKEAFRADLYYRLAVVVLEIPPLRERTDDIPLLAGHFLRRLLAADGRDISSLLPQLDSAFSRLKRYAWPGNVRELRNACERAAAMIDTQDEPADVLSQLTTLPSRVTQQIGSHLPLDAARAQFDREYVRDVLDAAGGDVAKAAEIAEVHKKSFERLMRRYQISKP